MKKVLFVIHNLGYGGAERSLVNLLQELPRDVYEIDLLLFQKRGDFLQQLPDGIRVLDTPEALNGLYAPVRKAGKYCVTKVVGTACSRIARKTKKSRSAFRWRHFYRNRIEMLPTHYDVAIAYVGSEILYYVQDRVDADRKLVWIHNDYCNAGYSKADDAPYFAQVDGIVSVSEECVEVLRREFPEHIGKIHYIENISSSAIVRKQADAFVPKEYEGSECNILSVGRLWPQKGFDMAIQAAAILKNLGLRFRWFVLGEGSLRESLQKQIDAEGLTEHFILAGSRNNPYPYMKHCSLLVQPSRYEGKSVVLDEAKILCVPIVATAYPTVADQILSGKEGLITEMMPEGIAACILELIQNPEKRELLREYLRSREYGNQAEVEKYRKLLDEE